MQAVLSCKRQNQKCKQYRHASGQNQYASGIVMQVVRTNMQAVSSCERYIVMQVGQNEHANGKCSCLEKQPARDVFYLNACHRSTKVREP